MSNPKRTRKEIREVIKKLKKMKEEEEIEYTCCNVEITQEIKETGRCPSCSENI